MDQFPYSGFTGKCPTTGHLRELWDSHFLSNLQGSGESSAEYSSRNYTCESSNIFSGYILSSQKASIITVALLLHLVFPEKHTRRRTLNPPCLKVSST